MMGFPMRIAFANDHAAFAQRRALIEALRAAGHEVVDFGSDSPEAVDYPDPIGDASRALSEGRVDRAVLMCGTGIGASITANKFRRVRCARVDRVVDAEVSRRHNDANALALAGRSVPQETNLEILRLWLATPFEGGRHQRRLDKIAAIEDREASRAPRP